MMCSTARVRHDDALRPNQLLAVSLPYSPLNAEQQKAIVDACARHLLTSHGLRSLAPDHTDLHRSLWRQPAAARCRLSSGNRLGLADRSLQSAHLRVYKDPAQVRAFLQPLLHHLTDHGVGQRQRDLRR